MRIARSFLPIFIGLAITCSVLLLLSPQITYADPALLIQTTVEDFNRGSFYRTGMTRDDNGEITLLRSGIAGEWLTNINATGFVPRYGHAAIVYNSRIYVFGGRTGDASLRSIQYAQINTQTHNLSNWITSSVSLPTSIYTFTTGSRTGVAYLSAVELHGRVYLLGGENGDQTHRYSAVAFATLNPTTGELGALAATASLPKPLSEGQAVAVNNRIYYLGGRTGTNNIGTNTVYYAEPLTTTGVITAWFTTTLPLPYPPYGHMAIGTAEGRLYAMAGVSLTTVIQEGGVVPNVYYADPITSTGDVTQWQPTLNLPRNVFAGSAVYFGGQIYAVGGALDGIVNPSELVFAAFDELDGGVITWTATSVITPARIAATTLVNSDGWIYVVGGASGSQDPIQTSIINAGATTGNAGLIYAGRGTFRSAEFDLIKSYEVTGMRWRTFLSDPDEMTVTVRYRYRQSFGAYSDWSEYVPSTSATGIATTSVPLTATARYFQYEVFFSTTNALTTPIFYQMELSYDIPTPPQFNKSASPASGSNVKAGDRITYTIRFTNTTQVTHTNVIVQDVVPEGTSYVPGSIFASPGITMYVFTPTLTWDVGTLPPGSSGSVGFVVIVNNGLPEGTRIDNVVTFDSSTIYLRSNSVTHIAGIPPRLVKTHVLPTLWGSVQPDDLITYTLTYSNPPGSPALTNVIISDTLPPEVSFVSGAPAPTITTVDSNVVLSWNIASVPIVGTGSVKYTVRVNAPAKVPNGTLIKNAAQMTAVSRPSVSSNADSVKVLYRYDLKIHLDVDKNKAPAGSSLIYTYRFTNTTQMPITLTGVVAYAYLEPGLPSLTTTHVLNCAAPCAGWNYLGLDFGGNQTYSATVPPLGPNQSTSIALAAQISPTLPLDVLAVSNYSDAGNEQVGQGQDIDGSNQTARQITTVGGPDIAVQRIQAPALGILKRNLNVAVVLFNNGFAPTNGPDNKGWFGIDLYVKPYGAPPPSRPDDRYLGACPTATNPCPGELRYPTQYQMFGYPNDSLNVGQVFTVTFPLTIATPGRYWLYAQADTYWNDPDPIYGVSDHGRIIEGNELNNVFGPIEIVIDYAKIYLPIVRR